MLMKPMVVILGTIVGVLLNVVSAKAEEKTLLDAALQSGTGEKLLATKESLVAAAARPHRRSTGHRDARICLDAADNAATILCAEKYR